MGIASAPPVLRAGHIWRKMVRIDLMADRIFPLDRRELMAGLGAVALSPAMPSLATAQGRPSLALHAATGAITLRPGRADTPIWSLGGPTADRDIGFKRGDALEITLLNDLPVPTVLNWHGIEGVPAAEPLAARAPLAPGAKETLMIPLRHAGTLMCDLRLLGDGQVLPSRALALVVEESEPVAVDRDQVFLIEDWRLRPDGTAIAPGIDPKDTVPVYTINGLSTLDIPTRTNERLRFRFVNGCQRSVIAIKIEGHEVRVMAIDGQPAEPFPARNGSVALAPPLPSNGLPAQLDLKNALRFDMALGGPQTDWVRPATFAVAAPPSFRAKAGRTVVLALTNRAEIATVFHLHGHHFRLLDRLDDGWKPFWLDTLAVEPGQTQRIAFAAEHAGRWLIESMTTDWAAPRLVRWYSVE